MEAIFGAGEVTLNNTLTALDTSTSVPNGSNRIRFDLNPIRSDFY